MNFFIWISILLGFGGLCILGLQVFGISCSKRTINIIWIVIILSFSLVAFFAEPFISEDLYRHYGNAKYIACGNKSPYEMYFFWNLLLIISGKTGALGIISVVGYVIPRFATLLIWKDYCGNNSKDITFIYTVLCSISLCYAHAAISGVRNSASMAILAYAYLCLYLKKDKNWKIKFLLCILFAASFHIATFIPLFVLIVYEMMNYIVKSNKINIGFRIIIKVLIVILPLACGPCLPLIGKLLSNFKNSSYLSLISEKITLYTDTDINFIISNKWNILKFLMIACLIYILHRAKPYISKDYYKFSLYFTYFTLMISLSYSIMLDRMCYFISFLFIPAVIKAFENKVINKFFRWFYICLSGLIIVYYLNGLIAHETFSGIDFYKLIWGSREE